MSTFTPEWERRFLTLAEHIGHWSKDPSTRVGAVIVRPDKTIASMGYNGFPRGAEDLYTSRDVKLMRTVHAELNAILSAREPLHGYTIFISPLFPCANCAAAIIQAGIKSVVAKMGAQRPEWQASFDAAKELFIEADVSSTVYLME
jgi:dCMP deaminase